MDGKLSLVACVLGSLVALKADAQAAPQGPLPPNGTTLPPATVSPTPVPSPTQAPGAAGPVQGQPGTAPSAPTAPTAPPASSNPAPNSDAPPSPTGSSPEPAAQAAQSSSTSADAAAPPPTDSRASVAQAAADEEVEEVLDDDDAFTPHPYLQELVTVSSKRAQRPEQAAASVAVISRRQIDLQGYESVGEALADVPGMFVSYDMQNYNVAVRGMFGGARAGSRLLKIMIDGKSAGFVQGGVYYLGPEFIPMQAVERIEVMRGPASSVYGAGAYVGAINVVTRRPVFAGKLAGQSRVQFRGVAAGVRGYGGEATQSVVGQDGYALIGASYARTFRSGMRVPEESPFADRYQGRSSSDLAAPISLFGRGEYFTSKATLSVLGIAQFHDYAAEFYDLQPLTGISRNNIWSAALSANAEVPLKQRWGLRATLGLANGAPRDGDRFAYGNAATMSYTTRDFRYTEFSAAAEARKEFGKNGWILFGLDGYLDQEQLPQYTDVAVDTGAVMQRTGTSGQQLSNAAGYVQALLPVRRATIAAGVRYDVHNVFGGDVSGRLGMVLPVTQRITGKLFAGRSYRAPSAEQLYGRSIGAGDLIGASELKLNLTPQYLNGLEGELDVYVARGLHLNVAGYVNQYDDALAYVSEAGRLNPRSFDALAYGSELALRAAHDMGEVTVDGTVSAVAQSMAVDRTIVAGFARQLIPDNEGVPQLSAVTRGSINWSKYGLGAFFRWQYTGRRTPSQSNLVANQATDMTKPNYFLQPYQTLALGLALKPRAVSKSLRVGANARVTNLLGASYSEVGFNGVDIPGLPRTFWASANAEF